MEISSARSSSKARMRLSSVDIPCRYIPRAMRLVTKTPAATPTPKLLNDELAMPCTTDSTVAACATAGARATVPNDPTP